MGRRTGRRRGGWNKGMVRYSKGNGRYGYYDPNFPYKTAGTLLLVVGIVSWCIFPLNVVMIISGIVFLSEKQN